MASKARQGDYHGAMTNRMFMDWIKKRLTPALKKEFCQDRKMIPKLDKATQYNGCNGEAKVPESSSKTYDTCLLQKHSVKRIRVERTRGGCQGRFEITAHNFEVPQAGEILLLRGPRVVTVSARTKWPGPFEFAFESTIPRSSLQRSRSIRSRRDEN